jgi:hypothetical protein
MSGAGDVAAVFFGFGDFDCVFLLGLVLRVVNDFPTDSLRGLAVRRFGRDTRRPATGFGADLAGRVAVI